MNDYDTSALIQLLLLIPFLAVAILFLLTQHRTLALVRLQNRQMPPGQVWLQLIPFFGLFWQFIVIKNISFSIRDELNTPDDDSIFGGDPIPTNEKPTYAIGIAYAVLFCITIIMPGLLKSLTSLSGMVCWIVYWVQLSGYARKLKQRTFLA